MFISIISSFVVRRTKEPLGGHCIPPPPGILLQITQNKLFPRSPLSSGNSCCLLCLIWSRQFDLQKFFFENQHLNNSCFRQTPRQQAWPLQVAGKQVLKTEKEKQCTMCTLFGFYWTQVYLGSDLWV